MSNPKVSIIIPTFNHADYLAEALQSALAQTYPYFEVVVVNAGSLDRNHEYASQFAHPQIRCVLHEKNLSRAAAMNIGIRASSGEIIAFLDAHDMFHPEKLQTHVTFFEERPDVGAIYNGHFEIAEPGVILSMWRPPPIIALSDLVLDLRLTLSDIVLRRDWAYKVSLFDENYSSCADILDLNCRMALAGCQFAGIDRPLSYCRHHSESISQNLRGSVDGMISALEIIFAHPRCPQEVLTLRETALARIYLIGSYRAFAQNETSLGQEFIRKSIRLDRSILDTQAKDFLESLALTSIEDGGEHEPRLERVFEQLPPELAWITQHRDWAIAWGYLYQGVRAIIWGRPEQGGMDLTKATALGARLDKPFCHALFDQLAEYEAEFGPAATDKIVQDLTRHLEKVSTRSFVRSFNGVHFVNRAFKDYHQGQYEKVPRSIRYAVASKPNYLANRGVLAILIHSLTRLRQQPTQAAD